MGRRLSRERSQPRSRPGTFPLAHLGHHTHWACTQTTPLRAEVVPPPGAAGGPGTPTKVKTGLLRHPGSWWDGGIVLRYGKTLTRPSPPDMGFYTSRLLGDFVRRLWTSFSVGHPAGRTVLPGYRGLCGYCIDLTRKVLCTSTVYHL